MRNGMRRKTCQMEENSEPQKNCQDTSPKMDCRKERESEGKFNLCCRISCVYQLLFLTFQFHSCSRRNSNSSSASSQCEKFTTYKVFRYCQRVSQMRRIFESSLTEAKWKIDSNHQSKAASREILTCCKKSPARTEEERFKIIVNFSIWQILLFHFLYAMRKKKRWWWWRRWQQVLNSLASMNLLKDLTTWNENEWGRDSSAEGKKIRKKSQIWNHINDSTILNRLTLLESDAFDLFQLHKEKRDEKIIIYSSESLLYKSASSTSSLEWATNYLHRHCHHHPSLGLCTATISALN